MGNPGASSSWIARHLAPDQSPVVIKSGSWLAPGRVPGHWCGTNARPEVFDAMLRQAGVIRVENLHQLFDVAQVVVPMGNRVAIVTNSDALGLSAQACQGWGLDVTHGPVALPSEASGRPSVALDAASSTSLRTPSRLLRAPTGDHRRDVANALRSAAAEGDKTRLATFLGMRGVDDGASSVRGTGGG